MIHSPAQPRTSPSHTPGSLGAPKTAAAQARVWLEAGDGSAPPALLRQERRCHGQGLGSWRRSCVVARHRWLAQSSARVRCKLPARVPASAPSHWRRAALVRCDTGRAVVSAHARRVAIAAPPTRRSSGCGGLVGCVRGAVPRRPLAARPPQQAARISASLRRAVSAANWAGWLPPATAAAWRPPCCAVPAAMPHGTQQPSVDNPELPQLHASRAMIVSCEQGERAAGPGNRRARRGG